MPASTLSPAKFNQDIALPYELRLDDFRAAMQDVYDFFRDVNTLLLRKGLHRLDDMLRPAAMSGMLSDMLTASLARHSRVLVENGYFNGHPDLVVQGQYAHDSVQAAKHGVEVKSTRKRGGAVDFHAARDQWLAVFVYEVDNKTEPARQRAPMRFRQVYCGYVKSDEFRRNARGERGTRTATPNREAMKKLRENWVYLDT